MHKERGTYSKSHNDRATTCTQSDATKRNATLAELYKVKTWQNKAVTCDEKINGETEATGETTSTRITASKSVAKLRTLR